MDFTYFTLVTMWSLSATLLYAKPTEHRHRHMRDVLTETQSENIQRAYFPVSAPIRHDGSKRHDLSDNRNRKGFPKWDVTEDGSMKYRVKKPAAYLYNKSHFLPVYGKDEIPKYVPSPPYNRNSNNIFLDHEDSDPRPKWGNLQTKRTTVPTGRPKKTRKYILRGIPTRKPRVRTTTEIPPYVQQVFSGKIPLSAIDDSADSSESILASSVKSEKSPRPLYKHSIINSQESSKSTTTASSLPTDTNTGIDNLSGPSICAWAVVSCCSAESTQVAESCFEARGCPGPFWDRSPCESDFAKAAIKRALEYYQ